MTTTIFQASVPLRDEAVGYWSTTLGPFLESLSTECVSCRPFDLAGYLRAACRGDGAWAGLCGVGEGESFDEASSAAYMRLVVAPVLQSLGEALLQQSPLPPASGLGAAAVALLGEGSPLSLAAAASVRAYDAAPVAPARALVERIVQRRAAGQAEALAEAAAAAEAHGGLGVEMEPAVDSNAFEAYLRAARG